MKNRRIIAVCLWSMCMCVCLMTGCRQKKEADEMTKLTETTIKETETTIKETKTTRAVEETKAISKIEIKWWAPCGSREEDKYSYITDKKLIAQIQKEAKKAAKAAKTEGKYIGNDPGLTGGSGYRLTFYNEEKVIGEMDIVNEMIMGIDDGEITKYYELKEASFFEYLDNSSFSYEK